MATKFHNTRVRALFEGVIVPDVIAHSMRIYLRKKPLAICFCLFPCSLVNKLHERLQHCLSPTWNVRLVGECGKRDPGFEASTSNTEHNSLQRNISEFFVNPGGMPKFSILLEIQKIKPLPLKHCPRAECMRLLIIA